MPSSVGAGIVRHQRCPEIELRGDEPGIGELYVFADDMLAVGAVVFHGNDRLDRAFEMAIGDVAVTVNPVFVNLDRCPTAC
jgi:hypothetical protein